MKKAAPKKVRKVIKNRNAGTFTEGAFWLFIRNALRRRSIVWKPISLCRERARRLYTGTNKRQKYEYQCNICKEWFKGNLVAVDHIDPVGSLKSAQDLPKFVEGLFCEIDNLQVICNECHNKKTLSETKSKKK